jgi:hypothetical protein
LPDAHGLPCKEDSLDGRLGVLFQNPICVNVSRADLDHRSRKPRLSVTGQAAHRVVEPHTAFVDFRLPVVGKNQVDGLR